MWVHRFTMLALVVAVACGGKSIRTTGGEAGAGSECGEGRVECDGSCIDLQTDEFNCAACGIRCPPGNNCVGGRCVSPPCSPEMVPCGDRCVDVRYDPSNCGACGFVCAPGQTCNDGRCFSACMGAICNGECVDVSSDPRHCGGCFAQCPSPESFCAGGFCQSVCPPEYLFCAGNCVDWRFDSRNCGGCGAICPDRTECVNGSCIDTCPTGTYCNGVCVDTSTDPIHCGGCNFACMSGRCAGGICVTGFCGNRVVEPGEEADPPPGPLMITPLNPANCRYDLSRIGQWYCHGGCGVWGGGEGCDQLDANAFCKLKMDNPLSQAVTFTIEVARPEPGVCCPVGANLGCENLGVLASRGVSLNVLVHPTNVFSTHQNGDVITNLVCTDP